MKHMNRILALALALLMILGLATTAYAADPAYSITVNNGKNGETYTAYKMLNLVVDNPTNPTAFRYTVNSAWTAFANTDEFKAAFAVDGQGYVTANNGITDEETWTADGTMSKLAEAAAKYVKDNTVTAADSETAAANGEVTLTLADAGYYVVTSTLGSRAMIETNPGQQNVKITEKNDTDTIDKKVEEDSKKDAADAYGVSNDAQIGDTVNFKSVATIAARSINVKIHDTMDAGLSFNTGSIKIYTDADLTAELADKYYTIQGTPDTGDTFTIQIDDSFAATASETQTLYVVYSATLNDAAIEEDEEGNVKIDPQTNKIQLTYGNSQSVEATTTTTTHNFSVFKHAKDSTDNLAGAIFSLKKNGAVVKLVMIDANNYRVATAEEIAVEGTTTDTFTTVASGDIVIWGVDADTDYTLLETEAPAGYNKLTAEKTVAVDAGNATRVDVENNAGSVLPSTGGIGTTLFYVIGGLLVAAAVVLLIAKKRMASAE